MSLSDGALSLPTADKAQKKELCLLRIRTFDYPYKKKQLSSFQIVSEQPLDPVNYCINLHKNRNVPLAPGEDGTGISIWNR